MKRTFNRFLVRFALLCVAVILGAIAVAQAQRGMGSAKPKSTNTEVSPAAAILAATPAPIKVPFQEGSEWAASPTEQSSTAEQPMTTDSAPPATVRLHASESHAQHVEAQYTEPQYTEPQYTEPQYTESQYAAEAQPAELIDAEFNPEDSRYSASRQQGSELLPAEFAASASSNEQTLSSPEIQPPATEFGDFDPAQPAASPADFSPSEFGESEIQPEFDQPQSVEQVYQSPPAASAPPDFGQPALHGDDRVSVEEPYEPSIEQSRNSASSAPEQYIPPNVSAPAAAAPVARDPEPQVEFSAELSAQNTNYAVPTHFVNNDETTLRPLQRGPATGAVGSGKPGTSDLEGPQLPNLRAIKTAPDEIQVGKSTEFQVQVRNVGSTTARDVTIRDEIPAGTEIVDTSPPAQHGSQGELIWQIGELQPGQEQTVSMRVMPKEEGEIGSVAQVHFAVATSAKARCTRPQISLEHVGPRQVLVGEDVVFKIKLTNPGTGIAHNVIIEEDVPPGLRHSAGKELEYPVGSLRPGETRLLELTLQADKPGQIENVLLVRADANLKANHSFQFEVIAPLLRIDLHGPRLRFLDREADFDIAVQNPGTASAKNIELVAHLPRGLKFKRADHQGEYNAQKHTVHWTLTELPANEMGTVRLTAVPKDIGDQKIRVEGKAAMNLSDSGEHIVTVDGLAALLYTVKDLNDPIEVGGNTTYEIRVVNQGSKTATNLILAAQAPAGMHPVSGEGPTRGAVNGQRIIFEPLARLAPQGETSYRVNVKATQPGDMRLKFHLVSDEVQSPVTKEESTHVYSEE